MKQLSPQVRGMIVGAVAVLLVWLGTSMAGFGEQVSPVAEVATFSNLPAILASDLPPEARATIELIAADGPYPFGKDDGTFQNREGFLPDQDRDYYHEYTVVTPGSSDRGARRIVAGDRGDLYYTDDHYASFREISQ